jgi:hypothetical protein
LATLRDAAEYIKQWPEAEHGLTHACATGQGQGAAKAIAGCGLIVARGTDKGDRAAA